MIRTIDRKDNKVLQKVVKPDNTVLRYQVGILGDAASFDHFNTLVEARCCLRGEPVPKDLHKRQFNKVDA